MKKVPIFLLFSLASYQLFAQSPSDNIIPMKPSTALPGEYPLGVYMSATENDAPHSWPVDAGVVLGLKPVTSNWRHAQLVVANNPSIMMVRMKDNSNDSWSSWRKIVVANDQGKVGIGTNSPVTSALAMQVHGASPAGNAFNNQLLISGAETTGAADTGGGIGFFGNDGTADRTWGWVRNLKENSTSGNYASYLAFATRPNGGSPTEVLRISSAGNMGIGTTTPGTRLQVDRTSPATSFEATVFLKGTETTGAANTGGALAFYGNDGANDRGWAYIRGLKENATAGNTASYLSMGTRPSGGANIVERIRINSVGNVGIGTTAPDAKLTVKGTVHAEEVKVDLNVPAPDYVFEESYELRKLEEVNAYIATHKHLPEVPSAKELAEGGIDLGAMNMLLLKKIEEMTLYQIQLLQRIESVESNNEELKKEVKELKSLVQSQ